VYDYTGEDACDKNMEVILNSIDVAARSADRPFAALKVTALGKPKFLLKTSEILMQIRNLWISQFSDHTQLVTLKEFQEALTRIGIPLDPEQAEKLFKAFDRDNDGKIDYIEWTTSLQLEDLTTRKDFIRSGHNKSILTRGGILPLLNEHETELMDKLNHRLNRIAEAAYKKNVRLLIDAEQTYFQPVINHLCLNLQRKYNREKPIIYNTYQCYLTYSKLRINNDLQRAKREGFFAAGKLVRGAYMIQERKLAEEKGDPSPIFGTKGDTDKNYDQCVELLLQNIDYASFMLATHNQHSISTVLKRMDELDIGPLRGVYFGQLLGMSDNISFPLGMNGYQVYKYVPYGPIGEVIPYLSRRAQENSGILDKLSPEVFSRLKELTRRILSFGSK